MNEYRSIFSRGVAWIVLAASLAACASPSGMAALSAAGKANAPTVDGALPTDASVTALPDGGTGWFVSCDIGRDFKACESRAQNLCPKGFHTIEMKQRPARNAPGMQISNTGNIGTGTMTLKPLAPNAVERTVLIKCV